MDIFASVEFPLPHPETRLRLSLEHRLSVIRCSLLACPFFVILVW
jgi:hypothetical protein